MYGLCIVSIIIMKSIGSVQWIKPNKTASVRIPVFNLYKTWVCLGRIKLADMSQCSMLSAQFSGWANKTLDTSEEKPFFFRFWMCSWSMCTWWQNMKSAEKNTWNTWKRPENDSMTEIQNTSAHFHQSDAIRPHYITIFCTKRNISALSPRLESDGKLKSKVLSIHFKLSGIDGDINCCPYSHVQCSKNNVSNFDEYIIQWNIGFAFSQPYVLLKRIHLRRIGVFIVKRDNMFTTFAFDRRDENKDFVITPIAYKR